MRYIGYAMLIFFFSGLIALMSYDLGVGRTLSIWGIAILCATWFVVAIHLISET